LLGLTLLVAMALRTDLPAMLQTLESGVQTLIAGRQSSQAFLQSLQEVWNSSHGH